MISRQLWLKLQLHPNALSAAKGKAHPKNVNATVLDLLTFRLSKS
jgi:hypothetical protein